MPGPGRPYISGYVDIQAKLSNGGVVGTGDESDDVLTLSTYAKGATTDGTWKVISGGTLKVDVQVSGSADVELILGKLDVNANFTASGVLEFGSSEGDVRIEVSAGKRAVFGAP